MTPEYRIVFGHSPLKSRIAPWKDIKLALEAELAGRMWVKTDIFNHAGKRMYCLQPVDPLDPPPPYRISERAKAELDAYDTGQVHIWIESAVVGQAERIIIKPTKH
jgi:hypothetical protein